MTNNKIKISLSNVLKVARESAEEIEKKSLTSGFDSKRYSQIKRIISLSEEYEKLIEYNDELNNMLADADLKDMALEEIETTKTNIDKLILEIYKAFNANENINPNNIILEIRPGTGGDEACLFANTLLKMYNKFSIRNNWKFEIMSISIHSLGGIKESVVEIIGKDAYRLMKFESGTHRVQRVPITESSGRIHTSAATVAILPQPEELEVKIDEKDIRIDVYRSSGPGGQSVNTTDSAVRITHIPTGIVVIQQDEKSQHKNKSKAMKILRARIYEKIKSERDSKISAQRRKQVGSGDRSERIRTYNFPQLRITDHRIQKNFHNIEGIVNEGQIEELQTCLEKEFTNRFLSDEDELIQIIKNT